MVVVMVVIVVVVVVVVAVFVLVLAKSVSIRQSLKITILNGNFVSRLNHVNHK